MVVASNSENQNNRIAEVRQASVAVVSGTEAFLLSVGGSPATSLVSSIGQCTSKVGRFVPSGRFEEVKDCKYKDWLWLKRSTGEVREFNCDSWHCLVHRGKVAYRWACRVAEARPERMITLTNVPRDMRKAYRAFGNLRDDIRERYEFKYARFLEVGVETGMLHWHLAQLGDYIPQRWLSWRAEAHGLGEVVDIRKCYGKAPGWYMAKYVTKEAAPGGWRKVTSSRGFFKHEPTALPDGEWVLIKGVIGK